MTGLMQDEDDETSSVFGSTLSEKLFDPSLRELAEHYFRLIANRQRERDGTATLTSEELRATPHELIHCGILLNCARMGFWPQCRPGKSLWTST